MSQYTKTQNLFLSKNETTKVGKVNFWINVSLLSSFVIYQLWILLDGVFSLKFNPLVHIFYILSVIVGLFYLIIRGLKVYSSKYFPYISILVLIMVLLFQALATEFIGPLSLDALKIHALWIAPWNEESCRFISFVILYDLIRKGYSNRCSKILAFNIFHFAIFYLMHTQYNLLSLSIFLTIGVGMFFLTFHLVLMENYLIPIIMHSLYNYFILYYVNAIPPLIWCAIILLPYLISVPFYWFFIRKAPDSVSILRDSLRDQNFNSIV